MTDMEIISEASIDELYKYVLREVNYNLGNFYSNSFVDNSPFVSFIIGVLFQKKYYLNESF